MLTSSMFTSSVFTSSALIGTMPASKAAVSLLTSRLLSMALLIGLLGVYGCAKDIAADDPDETELAYYNSARSSLQAANYAVALQKLQLLESRFPFGRYAQQAQLEIIYAYYKSAQSEEARSAADRFIRLHPQHPNVDYAYYLKGIISFDQDKSILSSIIPTDPSARDPGAARASFNDFTELLKRYPSSQYAPDAQNRMRYLRNLLAGIEVHVASYYIRRGAYAAAANRGRYVLENFQGSVAVPDALALMVEAYQLLEMDELARQALQVLSTNFPEHRSLDKDGNFRDSKSVKSRERSWINILTFGLLG